MTASIRIAKRPLPFAFNPAVMACATLASVAVRGLFGSAQAVTGKVFAALYRDDLPCWPLCAIRCQFRTDAIRFAIVTRRLWQTWKKGFLWTSITYFAGASAAGIIARID
ncbi:MAG: hypothetical protein U0Y68_16760 [Blastocatellia bacterium]